MFRHNEYGLKFSVIFSQKSLEYGGGDLVYLSELYDT